MSPESGIDERSPSSLPLDKAPHRIAGMFDAIAGRYDLLNRLLSAGLDQRWRARAVDALGLTGGQVVLDLCTGTADLALALATSGSASVVGVDFAGEMLRCGHEKVREAGFSQQVRLVRGDAMCIPMSGATVDAATIGFGIRNVQTPDDALTEIKRVLRPGGRLAILEFGFPRTWFLRAAYRWYFPPGPSADREARVQTPERLQLPASLGGDVLGARRVLPGLERSRFYRREGRSPHIWRRLPV